jgi:hypothetical protein
MDRPIARKTWLLGWELDNLPELTREGTWAHNLTDVQTCEVDQDSFIMLPFLRIYVREPDGKNYGYILFHAAWSKKELHLVRDTIRKAIQ